MFEHLGPIPEVVIDKKKTNYKLYLSLLVLSVFVFTFSFSIGQGPQSYAENSDNLSARVLVDSSDKQIVASAKNFSVFDFVVDVDRAGASLYKLNILVEGIYNIDLLEDLKLFHNDVQLGSINKIDSQGKMYFDLSDYRLPAGQNRFSLFFTKGTGLDDYPLVKFKINKEDVFLNYDGHIFAASGDFPLESGLVNVLDKGYINASNMYLDNDFLINANQAQQIASFSLGSIGERADLKEIVLSYENLDKSDYENSLFVLAQGTKPISQAIANEGQIVFNINSGIVLQESDRSVFQLHTSSLAEGQYKFFVDSVKARGFWSGQEIFLADRVLLSQVEARPYYIKIQAGDLNQNLSEGWNKIYTFNISAVGRDQIYLNKVTWAIDKQNLEIDGLELYKDGQPYIADIILRDNKIVAKTEATKPLKISQQTSEISLLANLVNVEDRAKIETVLLPDKKAIDEDNFISNLIWSDGDNFYNSYNIPYLPLEAGILSN